MSNATDLINRYYEALNHADWAAYDDFFTADAELEGPGELVLTGVDGMRLFDMVWKNGMSDFTITPIQQSDGGTFVCSENAVFGTHDGVLSLPTGDVAPTGAVMQGKYVGTFEFHDGKIAKQHIYFDRMQVAETLGLIPAPTA